MKTIKQKKLVKPILPQATEESFLSKTKNHKMLLVLLVILVFGNTVFNKYSLDDALDIYENYKVLKGITGIPEIFTTSFCIINGKEFDYRPISPTTFAIEYQIFGLNPNISHAFNVILYIIVVLLAYKFLRLLLHQYKPVLVFIIMVLFTIHPLHTEVVASLKNRQELLAYIFGFLSMIRVHKYICEEQNYKHVIFAVIFMVLSLLSKLAALPFIGMIVFMIFYYGNKSLKINKIILAALFIIIPLIIVFFTKDWLFRDNYTFDESPLFKTALVNKIGTTFKIYMHYFRLLVIPYPLCFYYGFDTIKVIPVFHPVSIFSIACFIYLINKTFNWIKQKNVKGVLLLFFLMSISMYNNITFIYPGMLSDRAMFMASTWCIALVVIVIYDEFIITESTYFKPVNKHIFISIFSILFVYYSIWSIKRNAQWKTQLSLMEADIPHLYNSSFSNFLYGWTLLSSYKISGDKNQKELANYHLHRAMEINKYMPEPNYRLGLMKKYMDNDLDSAEYYFRRNIELNGNVMNGFKEFALTAFDNRKYNDALPYFEKVYNYKPTDTINLFYYVQAVYMVNGSETALKLNQKLMEYASETQYPYINNATIFKIQNKNKETLQNLENAVKYGGSTPQILEDIRLLKTTQ